MALRLGASVRMQARRTPASHAVDIVLTQVVLSGFAWGAKQDFPIWENKRYHERPALALGDGPIGLYRRWAQQFYEDAAYSERPPARGDPMVSTS